MLLKIIIALAVILGAFLAYVAIKPSYSEISREVAINASPEKVFGFINNRTIANSWNPFLQKDKQAKITFEGPEVGVGSATIWEGGKELGKGRATVTEVVPNQKLTVKLEYQEPFVMTQEANYLLRQEGGQTIVTWKVSGHGNFLSKLFCTFMDMEKMVGDVFSDGLNQLKTQVEKAN
jgi:uncharacterized protein YndB with AHSA1/START domain